jgi:hypothetical protein
MGLPTIDEDRSDPDGNENKRSQKCGEAEPQRVENCDGQVPGKD